MKRGRIFYGWWVLAAAFLVTVVNCGSSVYAFSLFVKPLQATQGWDRSQIMAGFFLWSFLAGVASPAVGRLTDRWGTGRVFALGAALSGAGFLLLSFVTEAWQFIAAWGLIGVTMAGTGHVPASAVVSNWFFRRRGLAIGTMSVGIGVGGMVMAPLLGAAIPALGWRLTYGALGMLTWAVVIPLALLVIKTRPSDMGLYPDGVASAEVAAAASARPHTTGLPLKRAMTGTAFWLIAVSFLFGATSQAGVFQSQVPFLEDTGYPLAVAAAAFGGVAMASATGKFVFGWLCDRIPPGYAWAIGLALQASGTAILLTVRPDTPAWVLWAYAIVLGLGVGSWLPAMSMAVSTRYGLESYGAIFGAVSFAWGFGQAAGPLIAGRICDVSGTYQPAFLLSIAMFALGIIAILPVSQPKGRT